MESLPDSIPVSLILGRLLVTWVGLLLASIVLVALWKARRHILHPVAFVRRNKRRVCIAAVFVAALVAAPPLAFLAFDLSFSFQSTVQRNDTTTTSGTSNSSTGTLAGRHMPWRRVGLIVSGRDHRAFTRDLAGRLADALRKTKRFEAVDVLEGRTAIDGPEAAYDTFLALQTADFATGGFFYRRTATADARIEKVDARTNVHRSAPVTSVHVSYQEDVRHRSTTTGLCSSRKHREIVMDGLAGQMAKSIRTKLEEVGP